MRSDPQHNRRRAIVAVGSNLGDSVATISRAVELLEWKLHTSATRSSLYQTAPMYEEDQPAFVNGVVSFDLHADPFDTLACLLDVEAAFGRIRDADARFGARTIDLDLVAMEGVELATSALALPHPRCHERAFVLRPLVDIHPDWVHPQLGRTARQLLDSLDDSPTSSPASWTPLAAPRWASSSSASSRCG